MATLTPMLRQYLEVKEQYADCIVFFRLGDFYEMFFDDAKIASQVLELTLTGRGEGENRAPMCGIPYHAADNYLHRLVQKGYKVAICEQTETPEEAKGIVRREVVRVVTPGTVTDTTQLEDGKNNFLACMVMEDNKAGLAFCDVSTGELSATETEVQSLQHILDALTKVQPSEIIVNHVLLDHPSWVHTIKERFNATVETFDERAFDHESAENHIKLHFGWHSLGGTALDGHDRATRAVGGLLKFLQLTQKINLSHITSVNYETNQQYMEMDASTRKSLELTETLREKQKKGSLLGVLDKTKTAMGARLLRRWVEQPLLQIAPILKRLDAVEELHGNQMMRLDIQTSLTEIYDFERLLSKITYGTVNGRDLIALKASIAALPPIKEALFSGRSSLLVMLYEKLDLLKDIHALIEQTIDDQPPFSVREGGIIKTGYHAEIDTLRSASVEGKKWLAALENEEREKTGIKTLKIGYNKVFGYFLEISKGQIANAPDRYIRKQTLANCERYITPELKEIEDTVLGAYDKVVALEYHVFCDIRERILKEIPRIQKSARMVAMLDCLHSLAEVAVKNHYVKPEVNLKGTLTVEEGRHPVVERMLTDGLFVPNDTLLDIKENRLCILTGPNMAGKSTYMRQVALITLMAQMGSFVPAKKATVGLIDRIFTRVGASDDLASGQSTFMVEMTEVANILNHSTQNSLLILDEMGRGTSTYDGLSLAWAVVEYIADVKKIGAKTLFATHYHELTELESQLDGVKNYCVAVKKRGDDITFLRKIIRGGADESYGIEVAKLAGVPNRVIERAKNILKSLEEVDIAKGKSTTKVRAYKVEEDTSMQMGMFEQQTNEVLEAIKRLELSAMTPIEALNFLYNLQKKVK